MPKLRASRIRETVILVAVCVGAAMLGFILRTSHTVAAKNSRPPLQKPDEKVIERREFLNEPFQFGGLTVKKVGILPGRKFSLTSIAKNGAEVDDWLEDLTFTLENTSAKRITYVDVELDFPETQGDRPMMVVNQLGIGRPPYGHEWTKQIAPLMLEPGDKLTFNLSAQQLQMIKDFLALRKFQLKQLSRVIIRLGYLIFDDGIKWEIGRYYRPNPNAPGGYERISQ
ncbi:MAG TPA: hypothetical protein VGL29_10465 [Blastocatellia bacterium]